jgi:hypothetical protein
MWILHPVTSRACNRLPFFSTDYHKWLHLYNEQWELHSVQDNNRCSTRCLCCVQHRYNNSNTDVLTKPIWLSASLFIWTNMGLNDAPRLYKACRSLLMSIYRVIKKSLCKWWLLYRKLQVVFKVSLAGLRAFIDSRLTLTPSIFPNSNYGIMVSD